MTLKVLPQLFSICKVADYSQIDLTTPFVFTATTDEERSLVCPTELTPNNTLELNDNWRAFKIEGVLDFTLIGILSRISTVLANNNIGLFTISTFNTDYIFIKAENLTSAIACLTANCYKIV